MRFILVLTFFLPSYAFSQPVILKIANPRAHSLFLYSDKTRIEIPSLSILEVALLDVNSWEARYGSGGFGKLAWNLKRNLKDFCPESRNLHLVVLALVEKEYGVLFNSYDLVKARIDRDTYVPLELFERVLGAFIAPSDYFIADADLSVSDAPDQLLERLISIQAKLRQVPREAVCTTLTKLSNTLKMLMPPLPVP